MIKQLNGRSRRLPDFRNLGIALRLILLVHAAGLATVLVRSTAPGELFDNLLLLAARLELPLFLLLVLVYAARPVLAGVAYRLAAVSLVWLAATVTLLSEWLAGRSGFESLGAVLWAMGVTLLALAYFDYRDKLLSPSLAEARLQALTVRMRPHFLFNSLNAVLGVIRSDPKRAEAALEEMSDVFRAVMKENRDLIPLDDELALCERYLGLERLRLGDRLHVDLDMEDVPPDALVPPLMLQPLVENAVYHGIEPLSEPGTVTVRGALRGGEIVFEVTNPIAKAARPHQGNQMAMANIRERLMLFYDLEASLAVEVDAVLYRVRIRLPYRRKSA
ncbi:MAG: histidine kinase [Rhodocyclaceae bacterium]|nr:histidine kinase [Rhodocyclaceae bacterium]